MKKLLLSMILVAFAIIAFAQKNPAQVSDLLNRIGGEGTSSRIETRVKRSLSKDGKDVFEISSKKGKPYIEGSSLSALTTGIGWYLNHYAHINLSWNNLTTDLSKVNLPVPQAIERRECSAVYRYYLNYCTYSYSMAFWTRERWEQEIDWMALHGINIPLALVGTDVVWKNVLAEAGYKREDIDKFVAGPGFQAWWLMNNLEGWGSQSRLVVRKRRAVVQIHPWTHALPWYGTRFAWLRKHPAQQCTREDGCKRNRPGLLVLWLPQTFLSVAHRREICRDCPTLL